MNVANPLLVTQHGVSGAVEGWLGKSAPGRHDVDKSRGIKRFFQTTFGRSKHIRQRYFVLEGSVLKYYRDQTRKKECGSIDLGTVLEVQYPSNSSKSDCSFDLVTDGRTFTITAATVSDVQKWKSSLEAVVDRRRRQGLMAKSIRNLRSGKNGKIGKSSSLDGTTSPLAPKKVVNGSTEHAFRFETLEQACLEHSSSRMKLAKDATRPHRGSLVLTSSNRLVEEERTISRWGELTGNTPPSCLSFLSQDRLQHIPSFSSFVASTGRKVPLPQNRRGSGGRGNGEPGPAASTGQHRAGEIKAFVGWLQEQRNDVLRQQEDHGDMTAEQLHLDPWATGFNNTSNIQIGSSSSSAESEVSEPTEADEHRVPRQEAGSSDIGSPLKIAKEALASTRLTPSERLVKKQLVYAPSSFQSVRGGANSERTQKLQALAGVADDIASGVTIWGTKGALPNTGRDAAHGGGSGDPAPSPLPHGTMASPEACDIQPARSRSTSLLRRLNISSTGKSPYRARAVRKQSGGRRKTNLFESSMLSGLLSDLMVAEGQEESTAVQEALKFFEVLWVPPQTHLNSAATKQPSSPNGLSTFPFSQFDHKNNDKATTCWVLMEGSVQLGLPIVYGKQRTETINAMIDQLQAVNGAANPTLRDIAVEQPTASARKSRARPSLSVSRPQSQAPRRLRPRMSLSPNTRLTSDSVSEAMKGQRSATSHSPLSEGDDSKEDQKSMLAAAIVVEAVASPIVLNVDSLLTNKPCGWDVVTMSSCFLLRFPRVLFVQSIDPYPSIAAGMVVLGSLSHPAQRVASVPSLKALVSRMTFKQLLTARNRPTSSDPSAVTLKSYNLSCGSALPKSTRCGTECGYSGDNCHQGQARWGVSDWLEDRVSESNDAGSRYTGTDALSPKLLEAYFLWRRRMEALLSCLFRPIMLHEGDVLFQEGDDGDCAYIVVAGEVSLSVTSVTGSPVLLKVAVRGDCVGESGLLAPQNRTLLATALTPCLLLRITHSSLSTLLSSFPGLWNTYKSMAAWRTPAEMAQIPMLSFLVGDNVELLAPLLDLMSPVNLVSRSRVQHVKAAAAGSTSSPEKDTACGRTDSLGRKDSMELDPSMLAAALDKKQPPLSIEAFAIAHEFGIDRPRPQAQSLAPFSGSELLRPSLAPSTRQLQEDLSPWPSAASHRFYAAVTKEGLDSLLFVMVGALEVENNRGRSERFGPGDWFGGQTLFKQKHEQYTHAFSSPMAPYTLALCLPGRTLSRYMTSIQHGALRLRMWSLNLENG